MILFEISLKISSWFVQEKKSKKKNLLCVAYKICTWTFSENPLGIAFKISSKDLFKKILEFFSWMDCPKNSSVKFFRIFFRVSLWNSKNYLVQRFLHKFSRSLLEFKLSFKDIFRYFRLGFLWQFFLNLFMKFVNFWNFTRKYSWYFFKKHFTDSLRNSPWIVSEISPIILTEIFHGFL